MKFSLSLELSRESASMPVKQVIERSLELVRLADAGGFHSVFTGEHHGIELTIAPNPFIQLAVWARETSRIRLGTAVLAAPYWHPIRLAGEAGLLDVISDGRLELGIGRGAYAYEFERMGGGISVEASRASLLELVPAIKALWEGDYAHQGTAWSFPATTAVPHPVQDPHPPIWISARHPDVFRFAVDNRCHVMATPLHLRFDEVIALRERLDRAVADSGDGWQPQLMMLRNTGVYDSPARIPDYVTALIDHMRYFDTLFQNVGGVHRGFVDKADLARVSGKENYDEDALVTNHMFGTPEQVIEKLKMYEAAGVDTFMYGGTWGLSHPDELRSLELFITEVMPAFADARMDSPPGTAQTAALTP